MVQTIFVISCALICAVSANNPQPRDLVDEVKQQLFELQNIAYGEIFVARDKLQHLQREFSDDAKKVILKASIDIQQEHETINSQLTTIKDLAQSAGNDISSCTNNREDVLNSLPANFEEQIAVCIEEITQIVATTISDARYVIDIYINKVHHFEYQIKQCQENFECMAPILTQMLEEKIKLPMDVKGELLICEDTIKVLELSVQNCVDDSVAEYMVQASGILGEITNCAEAIIA